MANFGLIDGMEIDSGVVGHDVSLSGIEGNFYDDVDVTCWMYERSVLRVSMPTAALTVDGLRVSFSIGTTNAPNEFFYRQWVTNEFNTNRYIDIANILHEHFNFTENLNAYGYGTLYECIDELYLKIASYDGSGTLIDSAVKGLRSIAAFNPLQTMGVAPSIMQPSRLRMMGGRKAVLSIQADGNIEPKIIAGGTTYVATDANTPVLLAIPATVNHIGIRTEDDVVRTCVVEKVEDCRGVSVSWLSKESGCWKTQVFDFTDDVIAAEGIDYERMYDERQGNWQRQRMRVVFPSATYNDWCYIRDLATADVVNVEFDIDTFTPVRCISMTESFKYGGVGDVEAVIEWRAAQWR